MDLSKYLDGMSHNLDDGKTALNLMIKVLFGQSVNQFRYRSGPMFYMYQLLYKWCNKSLIFKNRPVKVLRRNDP